MHLIDVRDVYKIYNPGENQVNALDGVNVLTVDLKKKIAEVSLEKEVSDETLKKAIADAGYKLKKIDD